MHPAFPKACSRAAAVLASLVFGLSIGTQAMADDGFSMTVMDVFAVTGRGTIMTGQVASGSVAVGGTVCVPLENGETAALSVDGIEMFRKVLERAESGQMVGLLVKVDKKLVKRGTVLHDNCETGAASE